MSTVLGVVQARMSSQRLPGKVLAPLGDRAVIDWVVQRARSARSLTSVVVATSTGPEDDPLAEHCRSQGYEVFRGSLDDVLDRVHQAAATHGADHVVRVTGDCPLVDGQVVDQVVAAHLAGANDFTANRLPPPHHRTFPIGLDVEVCTAPALERAWTQAREPHEREHVMPWLYQVPGRCRVEVVEAPLDAGDVRWTVDTAADLAAVRGLVAAVGEGAVDTPWLRYLDVWRQDPGLAELNAGVRQRTATDVDDRR